MDRRKRKAGPEDLWGILEEGWTPPETEWPDLNETEWPAIEDDWPIIEDLWPFDEEAWTPPPEDWAQN